VLVTQPIRKRNQPCVEIVLVGIVTANQQNRNPARIERIEDADWSAMDLDSQLAQVTVTRTTDLARVRKRQIGTTPFQQTNRRCDTDALTLGQRVPPGSEFVRVFDQP
jgi:hypothetical protein